MNTLQETARMQFEANKKARRQVFQQAAARGIELVGIGSSALHMQEPFLPIPAGDSKRLHSVSKDTPISGSDDDESSPKVSASMSLSQSRTPFSNTSQISTNNISSGRPSRYPNVHQDLPTAVSTTYVTPSVLSPIVTRMRERDADAMAEYKKRHRSGSAGTSTDNKPNNSSNQTEVSSNGGSSISHSMGSWMGIPQLATRRLRPSASAAQLRGNQAPGVLLSSDQLAARSRSGTDPTVIKGDSQVTSENGMPRRTSESKTMTRRLGISPRRPSDIEDYTGPSSEYAIFPPPPSESIKSPSAASAKSAGPSARRAAFALLSKPLSNTDSNANSGNQRSHRRGISTSELRG